MKFPVKRPTKRTLWTTVVCLLTATVTACIAFALWSNSANHTGTTITAGDFDLALGDFTWRSADGQSLNDISALNDYILGPGDKLELHQQLTCDFSGDNLQVELVASLSDLPANLSATWHLESADGTRLTNTYDTPLETPLALPNDALGSTLDLTAVITLTSLDTQPAYTDPTDPPETPTELTLGVLTFTARQVRS